jgi:GDP-L-fucose synthase
MESIRADLKKRPIGNFNGMEAEDEILELLKQQGICSEKSQIIVTVWGTGSPLREFMYSGDMADATVFIMERVAFKDLIPKGTRELRNTHINIGTGEEMTIANLAALLKEVTGFKGRLAFDPSKPDGTPRKFLDSSKLHSLGFKHSISLKEGAGKMYEWYLQDKL